MADRTLLQMAETTPQD